MTNTAQEQIVTRLQEALRLAAGDCAAQAARLHELLCDLADRTAALELTACLGAGEDEDRPVSYLRCSLPTSAGGEPVNEFLLIPFGEVALERPAAGKSFVFTRQQAESAKRWMDRIGRKLAIDYEHQSFDRFNTRQDGLRPAAGWVGGLEVREDGLWAVDVTWTDRAKELLRSGEYRYFSPVVFWTDEERTDVAALGPVALTNDPAMRGVQPLAAKRSSRGEGGEAECGEQGAESDSGTDETEEVVPRAELEAAEAEVAVLQRQLHGLEADAFVERGMRFGKILDSNSMDWREDYLRNPEAAEDRLARAPVLLPPGRVLALSQRGCVEPLTAAEREFRRRASVYGRWGISAEDLAAYDRALAAGRVVERTFR